MLFWLIFCALLLRSDQPLCSHMASPVYFAESINSGLGFWGVRCQSFFEFLLGQCGQAVDGQQSKGQLPDVGKVAPLDGDEQQQLRAPPLASLKMDWMLMGEHCNQRFVLLPCRLPSLLFLTLPL